MMAVVFATMLLALLFERFGPRRLSIPFLLLCLALSLSLFLWEVYSPDYGFRMPWLKVETLPFITLATEV